MKPIYNTLRNYAETMVDRRYAVLDCPDLSWDRNAETLISQEEEEENFVHAPVFFETELDGTSFVPQVVTEARGYFWGSLSPDGIYCFLRLEESIDPVRISLHSIFDQDIQKEWIVLFNKVLDKKWNLGMTWTRFIPKSYIPSWEDFQTNVMKGDMGIVVSSTRYPTGELAGFIDVFSKIMAHPG